MSSRPGVTSSPEGALLQSPLLAGLAEIPRIHLQGGPRYALLSTALAGAIEGLGIALLSHFIVSSAVQSGQLVCLSRVPWIAPRGYYLRWPEWRSDLDALKRFALLVERLSALPRESSDEPSEI